VGQRLIKIWVYSFFNLATRWGGWSTTRPGRFTPGKETRYPLYMRVGGRKGRSGRVQKISPTPGFHPRTVSPTASRCTDYATPAHPTNCARFPAVRHHSQAIIGSHHRTSKFYQVSSRPAIFKRIIRRHYTITMPFRS